MFKNASFVCVGLLCGLMITQVPKYKAGPTFAGQARAAIPQQMVLPQVKDVPLPPVRDQWPAVKDEAPRLVSFVEEQDAGAFEVTADDKKAKPEPVAPPQAEEGKRPGYPVYPLPDERIQKLEREVAKLKQDVAALRAIAFKYQLTAPVAVPATDPATDIIQDIADDGSGDEGRGGRIRTFIGRIIHRRGNGGGGCGILGRRGCG